MSVASVISALSSLEGISLVETIDSTLPLLETAEDRRRMNFAPLELVVKDQVRIGQETPGTIVHQFFQDRGGDIGPILNG
jgi:hypothetical protein